jgi:endonuclease YncB( thermonuclease family)
MNREIAADSLAPSRSSRPRRRFVAVLASSTLVVVAAARGGAPQQAPQAGAAAAAKPQTRPVGTRAVVDPARIAVDDGDTVVIRWPDGDEENVRLLGIDSPETRHEAHKIPLDQPFGKEARAFAQGAFAAASSVELIRSATLDPYGRTLGYLFVNGKNYSVLIIKARLAEESITFYGDNGLPQIAAEVLAASKAAGPLPFEPPHIFRKRMRALHEYQAK